jgi:hypothetical protein
LTKGAEGEKTNMKAHDAKALHRKLNELLALPAETEWLEFKQASRSFHFDKLGQYFSALSNEARLKKQKAGWLIFGVQNHPRKIAGTDFRRNRADLDNLKKEIADQTSSRLTFIEIHGKRGHPLKGRSREKTPLPPKKIHLFFACPLTFAPAQPRFIVTFFAPVISFSSVSSQPKLIRTSHPSGSRQLCFKRNA